MRIQEERRKQREKEEQSEQQRGRSWMGSPKRKKKVPKPIMVIRNSEDMHRFSSPVPSLPNTPHSHSSASSSLCSCENQHSQNYVYGKQSPAPLCSPPTSKRSYERPASSPRRGVVAHPIAPTTNVHISTTIATNRRTKKMNSQAQLPQLGPTVSRLRAMTLEPDHAREEAARSRETAKRMAHTQSKSIDAGRKSASPVDSELAVSVQQLIWETDEAFKAVGTALAEAKLASQTPIQSPLQQTLLTLPATTYQVPIPRARNNTLHLLPTPPITPASGGINTSRAAQRKRQNSISPLSPSPHSNSLNKQLGHPISIRKKSKAKKVQRPNSKIAARPPLPTSSSSRWILTAENVHEKLSQTGRLFSRIEADEMLTDSQLQEARQSRIEMLEPKPRPSTESVRAGSIGERSERSDSDATTIEGPFHLETLPSRIGSSGVGLNALSPVVEVDTPRSSRFDNSISRRDFATETPTKEKVVEDGHQPTKNLPPVSKADSPEDDSPLFNNISFPAPPPPLKSPRRVPKQQHKRASSSISNRAQPLLSPIAEVSMVDFHNELPPLPATIYNTQQQGRKNSELHMDQPRSPTPETHPDYLFFRGTPYTITMPTFRHGHIRLAKAELAGLNSIEAKLLTSPDETLDWTAFQMAILCGAGDFISDDSDGVRDHDAEMTDDLAEWFDDFGMEPGRLVHEAEDADMCPPSRVASMAVEVNVPGGDKRSSGGSLLLGSDSTRSSGNIVMMQREMVQIQPQATDLPISVSSEHPSGFWNTKPFDASKFFNNAGGSGDRGIKRWTTEGHPKKYQGPGIDVERAEGRLDPGDAAGKANLTRESVMSLPDSPMMDLVAIKGVDGKEEFVPMGFNLGHDLGDFLKWESEHAYAGGFYGAE